MYDSWWEMPEDPHNTELGRFQAEVGFLSKLFFFSRDFSENYRQILTQVERSDLVVVLQEGFQVGLLKNE